MPDLKDNAASYYAWALNVSVLTRGHVFLDVVREIAPGVPLTRSEDERFLRSLTAMTRQCLPECVATPVLCTPELSHERLFADVQSLVALQRARSGGETEKTTEGSEKKDSSAEQEEESSARGATRVMSRAIVQQAQKTSGSEKKPDSAETAKPHVLILHNVDTLPEPATKALAELLRTRKITAPASTTRSLGYQVSVSFLSKTTCVVPSRFVIVATSCRVPSPEWDAVGKCAQHVAVPHDAPATEELPPPPLLSASAVANHSMTYRVLEGFTMRVPIVLKARDRLSSPSMRPHREKPPPKLNLSNFRRYLTKSDAAHMDSELLIYVRKLLACLRSSPCLKSGPPPDVVDSLAACAKAHAALNERDFVIPSDVACVAVEVVSHRLVLNVSESRVALSVPDDVEDEDLVLVAMAKELVANALSDLDAVV